jgi:carboxypeptidase Q
MIRPVKVAGSESNGCGRQRHARGLAGETPLHHLARAPGSTFTEEVLVSQVKRVPLVLAVTILLALPLSAQTFPTSDPVIRAMWAEGTDRSQVEVLAQVLMDSIGPRLTGTPEKAAGHDWLVRTYAAWGIDAENEQYGTWRGWRRGHTHVDLIQPRIQTLNATLLGWSPGTRRAVDGAVVSLPPAGDPAVMDQWRRGLRGAWVLLSAPEASCRPVDQWRAFADDATHDAFLARRTAVEQEWQQRLSALGVPEANLTSWLADQGAAGAFTSMWSGGYGANRIFGDREGRIPVVALSCEDYGLLHRLADRRQGPRVRVDARSENLGTVPAFNTVATIPGSSRPDEYVVLSAHFDSWDGATGATDNGTGTIVMMEAMRILRAAYPNPARTIIAGHWGSEEQGLNGSRAFAADRPDVVQGMQALFNQDNGTGRIARASMQGLVHAGAHFARWLAAIPTELSGPLNLTVPGMPGTGGTDHASFICAGAPAFGLGSDPWDYFRYTWHTNLDTYDKIALDNVRHNALLVAMLAYMASEDPEFMNRERREMPTHRTTGQPMPWPECQPPTRTWEGYGR